MLIVDELGYVPLSQTGAELLFETFSQRHERGSTIVTSNLPFEEWTSIFGKPSITRCPYCRRAYISRHDHEPAARPRGPTS
ncbi:DNA replication protein DnaC [Rhodoblastus acidophilus]|nr:DNA replication protein DnaC [Rhodoblastus acidophilus]MCW2335660.1 DNA replication protein DnaC [Rhodoblastus acidophilus]